MCFTQVSFVVHFGGGLWGVFAEALLDSELGLFYCWDKRSILFVLWNVMGVIVIALWSGLLSAVFFVIMKYLGRLRVPKEMELAGQMNQMPDLCICFKPVLLRS